jgi:hypothetical protein
MGEMVSKAVKFNAFSQDLRKIINTVRHGEHL